MMKHILAPILLLVFLFPSLALGEEVTMDDLVEREGLYYKKFTEVPFTGKVTGIQQGKIKNGKREGPWVFYHDNGQIWEKGEFKNGNAEGLWVEYHENGQLFMKGNHKSGKGEGPWVSYFSNGQLMFKGTYKNGKEDGPWVFYNPDGTVSEKYTGTYKNGEKVN